MSNQGAYALPVLERQLFMLTPEWVILVFGLAAIIGISVYLLHYSRNAILYRWIS